MTTTVAYAVFTIIVKSYGGILAPGDRGYFEEGHKSYSADVPPGQITEKLAVFDLGETGCYDIANFRGLIAGREISASLVKTPIGYEAPAPEDLRGRITIEFDLKDKCRAAVEKAKKADLAKHLKGSQK